MATLASRDGYGDPSFNAPAAVLCRCEPDDATTEQPEGQELVTRYRIVTEAAILKTDRIWLPGDDQTDPKLGRQVMKVQPCPGEDGVVDHWETVV